MDASDHVNKTGLSGSLKKKIVIGIIFSIVMLALLLLSSSNRMILTSKPILLDMEPKLTDNTTTTTSTTTSKTASTTTARKTLSSSKLALATRSKPVSSTRSIISNITSTTAAATTTGATTTTYDHVLCNNMTQSKPVNISVHPCEKVRCMVILRESFGRLGNRMFMFASAYGLARVHNCRLHVSSGILGELSRNFKMNPIDEKMWLSNEEVNRLGRIPTVLSICEFFPKMVIANAFHMIEMTGYWQSYLYFHAYRDEIREFFSSRNDTLNRLAKYLTDMTQAICSNCQPLPNTTQKELRDAFQTSYNVIWISIHIRRTDFRGLGYASEDNYVRHAMSIYRKRYYKSDVRFIVASDDKPYCEKYFEQDLKEGLVFVLPKTFIPSDDLLVLTLCHHAIVTGGTYGFWAGYLGYGEVIHDIRYFSGCTQLEYYPPWFMLVGSLVRKPKVASYL